MTNPTAQLWWEQAEAAYASEDWPLLEGSLRRLLELVPPQAALWDLLGHALLQQGRSPAALEALNHAMALGASHFWTPHKLGDAHRALQQRPQAVQAYEQAIAIGSDSHLSFRNLLEVLHQIDPEQALERLNRFAGSSSPALVLPWQAASAWLEGAMAAALRVQGSELAAWLCNRGCSQLEVRAVLWRDAAYRLELELLTTLFERPCSRREEVLALRMRQLTVAPTPAEPADGVGPYV